MKNLVKGSKEFSKYSFKKYQHEFKKLVEEGQSPKALFIGCCDSRVVPTLITNTGPGDLFIVRNIGNFVPPFKPDSEFHATASAIEYAVSVLEVEDIIVCGHSHCGAIASLYKKPANNPDLIHVKKWLELGDRPKQFIESYNFSREDTIKYTEMYSTLFQLENLLTYPAIKRRVEEGKLFLNAWYYVIEDGEIYNYDFDKEEFVKL